MKISFLLERRQLVIFALASVQSLSAQIQWNQASGTNDYNTGANWVGGVIPGAGQTALFLVDGTQTVSFAGNAPSLAHLEVGITDGTLTFNSTGASGNVTLLPTNNIVLGTASGADVVIQKTGNGNFVFRSASSFTVGGAGGSNNTVTVQGVNVTAGSASSIIIVGFDNSSNNLLHAKDGAALVSTGGTIGRNNNSDNNTVRLSDAGTIWTLSGNPTSANLTLGITAGNDNNNLIVEDGALLQSSVELRAYRGTVHLDNGTIDLTYGAGTDQAFVMQAAGRLRGQGNLKAASLSSSASGATVEVGENSFGILEADFTGDGWNNTNIKLELGIGNIAGGEVAGTNYDLLDVNGTFTLGGTLEVNLASAVLPVAYDFALIKWSSLSGVSGDLTVNFINGGALDYEVRGDGLYLSAIPEPSVTVLLFGMMALRMRRRVN